ncbi:MAG: SusC/RagA family TonB-linked outer membrane protein [Salegentibacter mishustinae]|nr:SusC/RagA family TonB-linked outer membrane protein [Salegentibacter mishustinae]
MKNNYSRLKWVALIILGGILFFLSQSVIAATAKTSIFQEQEVSGIVSDQNGIPIPGVTITVKNTNRGVVTNLDGEYEITTPPNSTLVFSYIGYKKQEVKVDGRVEINIQLEDDISALGEVKINAGYYNTTKRESTGNISRVTAEEIELQPVVSPIQALQGRMAGVEITPGGSNPGTASTIRIRGTNSLREEGNLPLYIIDGVPINSTPIETNSIIGSAGLDPLNNLNVSNIASIEVLKDADATAIYGSRGANGVVLISTKTGKQRETGFEARVYTGATTVPNRLDLLNTQEYLAIRQMAFQNDEVQPTQQNAYDLLLWDQDRYTDWQEFLFGGTSQTTNANLVFSGGSDNTSFRVGGSYFTQGTVYPGDYDYNKVTGVFNLNHSSADRKFNINLSVNYGVDVNNLVGNISLNSATFLLPPNAPSIFNEDGTLNWEDWGEANLDNPFQGYFNSSTTKSNNLVSNLGLSYELFSGFKLRTTLGYTYFNSEELWKRPGRSYNPSNESPNNSSHLNSTRKSWIIEPQFIYEAQFNKLKIDALIGATLQENAQAQQRFQAVGYASESLIGNIAAAENIINPSRPNAEYRYSALFSRIGINWNRKYYINLTGRRDGSSRFGPNNRFANFGAVGAAWIFSEEPLIKKSFPFLSFGKFRGSYGTTGNDQIGDYGYLDAYEATVGPGGLYPTSLANPDYSWEINKKLEGGVELGFIDDRIRLGLSHYRNRSSNQLVGYSLPYITGFNSVQANLPATVQNKGWELEVTSLNLNNDKFRWQTSFNISFPENELLSYPDIEQSSYANTYRVGRPLNVSLLYEYTGIDTDTGLYTIRDVNEDGRFDYQDRINIQDQNREFYGGINNNLSYKNFTLQFLWEFVKQKGRLALFNAGAPYNIMNLDNGERDYQRISQSFQASRAYSYVVDTSFPFQDASYLRLKTLSLGYSIPKDFLQRTGLKDCKLFIHGQNLLTLTPYEGLDPELPSSGTSLGSLRTISGGLQINL